MGAWLDVPRTCWDRKIRWQAGVWRALDRAQASGVLPAIDAELIQIAQAQPA